MNYAKDYAEKVVAGKIIAGKKVILAAKRYLNDLKKADNDDFESFYDNERANKVIQFMEILISLFNFEKADFLSMPPA